MRFFYILRTSALIFAGFAVLSPVFAEDGEPRITPRQHHPHGEYMPGETDHYGKYIWGGPEHNETQLFLNDYKSPHNSQWDDDHWTPQDWITARGGNTLSVIRGFYKAGIVTRQYSEDTNNSVAMLEVGRRFIELSELEKRRTVAFFDHVFNVTNNNRVIRLIFVENDAQIGLFTKDGLQLQ